MSATPANWSQHARLLTLHTPLGADVLLATEVQIDEALGPLLEHAGLRIHLRAISADARLRPQALLGQPVRLDLATASGPRPFHGHITAFERSGADGGFGHYRLRIEPWLALLGQRSDAYVFQDMSVFDIVDELFADWQGRGTLAPAWRWDVAERSAYPQRSLTIQYHETDLDFLRRLLAEEGLFYWFEHRTDGALLVIADHNGAFADNAQPHIRYTQSGATLAADALDRWAGARRLGSSATAMASWDYRSVHMRQQMQPSAIDNGPAAPRLDDTLDPGPYAWHTQADGERLSRRRREALDVRLKTFRGHGTVRSAAPATVFTLDDHPEHDTDPAAQRRFLITAVRHRARNNLPHSGTDAYYRCRLDAVRAHIPWRPLLIDADGQPVDLRPHIVGEHSAIVVGEDGAPTHTDRDHRIRIQFHWQRGSRAASRLPHPSGADNAPASDALGTWVRVLSAAAGANWGAHFIPRPGQEVLVTFLHGNPDRPVVVGAAYNGRGADDAPGNRLAGGDSAASANAPTFFAGQAAPHAHRASLSGLRTQELAASRSGRGGYNQLVFDDTPGQGRIELGTTAWASRLQLGHLKYQHGNARHNDRGHGAELDTQGALALRAGAGLLLSTDARAGASGDHLDSREAIADTEQSHALASALADAATTHGATVKGEAAPLPALDALERARAELSATATTTAATTPESPFKPTGGGTGTVAAWSAPRIQFSAPGGIAQLTPASAWLVAGTELSATAGHDINLAAQGEQALAIAAGLTLFTVGKATDAAKPNQETGIALHAASGTTEVQAQGGAIHIAAEQRVTLASTRASVNIDAPAGHVLATAGGAYLRMKGNTIELHAPGGVNLHAGQKIWTKPQSASSSASLNSPGALKGCSEQIESAARNGLPFV